MPLHAFDDFMLRTWFYLILIVPLAAEAMPRRKPLLVLKPAVALFHSFQTDCQLLLSPKLGKLRDSGGQNSPKKAELLMYVDFLLKRRFHVSSMSLSSEPGVVKALLYQEFKVVISGDDLYAGLQNNFPSVEDAVARTPEGQKLAEHKGDSGRYKWSADVLVQIAIDSEALGIPFDEDILRSHSSLVGMKLSEKYGYPIWGLAILSRVAKNKLTVDKIRKMANLPRKSPHLENWTKQEIQWNKRLVKQILKTLQNAGWTLHQNGINSRPRDFTELLWNELGIWTNTGDFEKALYRFYGGWRQARRTVGIVTDPSTKYFPDKPNWSPEFTLEVLRYIYFKLKIMPTYSLCASKKRFAPLIPELKKKFKFTITGRTVRNHVEDDYKTFPEALTKAGIPYRKDPGEGRLPWDAKITLGVFRAVLARYPTITEAELMNERMSEIGEFIKERFGYDQTGASLAYNLKKFYGSVDKAKELLGYDTRAFRWKPYRKDFDQIDKAQVVSYFRELYKNGYDVTPELLNRYSDIFKFVFRKMFMLNITGRDFRRQVDGMYSRGTSEALKKAGVGEKAHFLSRALKWEDRQRIPEYLMFIQNFGITPTQNSLLHYSRAISWILYLEFDVICDGQDLLTSTIAEYSSILNALRYVGQYKRQSFSRRPRKVPVNAYTLPLIHRLLAEAEISVTALHLHEETVQTLMKYHFGMPIDMELLVDELDKYLAGDLERPSGESQIPDLEEQKGGRVGPNGLVKLDKALPVTDGLPSQRERRVDEGDGGRLIYESIITTSAFGIDPESAAIEEDVRRKINMTLSKSSAVDSTIVRGVIVYLEEHDNLDDVSDVAQFLKARGVPNVNPEMVRQTLSSVGQSLRAVLQQPTTTVH